MAKDLTQSSYIVEGNTFQAPIIHYIGNNSGMNGCLCGVIIATSRLNTYAQVAQWLYNHNFRVATKSYPVSGAEDMAGVSYVSIYSNNGSQITAVTLPFGANSPSLENLSISNFTIQILN